MTPMMSRPVLLALMAVVLTLPRPAQGQAAEAQGAGATLTVTGRAEVAADPDLAVVRLGAVAQAEEASAAQARVNQAAQKIITAVKEAGVAAGQIQTASVDLSPVYSDTQPPRPVDERPGGPRVTGYRASNTLVVRVENLKQVGPVIDAATAAGANEVHGVDFALADDTEARASALAKAAREAAEKAKVLADATGVKIEAVRHVEEGGARVVGPRAFAGAELARAASTPIEPGQVRVEATVTITYRISGAAKPEPARVPPGDK